MNTQERACISQSDLKKMLWYDPETGAFRWRHESRNGAIKPWDVAGTMEKQGYIKIQYAQKGYLAHRLAWLYVYGYTPELTVDHINGIRDDNRICNLRLATVKQNSENRKLNKNNSTGHCGVYYSSKDKKYVARIMHNKKQIEVGYFDSLEKAAKAVQEKRKELHSHYVGRDIAQPLDEAKYD